MTLDEIKIQESLGTLDSVVDSSFYEELVETDNIEILKFVALNVKSSSLRRCIAVNKNTPYSILRRLYKFDPDYYVRETAWDQIVERYERRFGPASLAIRRKIFVHMKID